MTPEDVGRIGKAKFSTKVGDNRGNGFMHASEYLKSINGEIKIESNIGYGASVEISFPTYGHGTDFQRGADIKVVDL